MTSSEKLKLAVTLALASAVLAGPTAQAANLGGEVLRVGGATATDRSLIKGWLKEMCDAATTPAAPGASLNYNVEVFTTNNDVLSLGQNILSTSDATQNYAVACRMRTLTGAQAAASAQDVVMVKYSGGSSSGVTPVANGLPLAASGSANWVNFASCRDATTGAPLGNATREEIPAADGLPNIVLYASCTDAGAQVTNAGLSDLEPRLIASGGGSLALTANPGASVPMGVAVSSNFFNALQLAQGLKKPGAGGVGLVDCTADDFYPACTPTLSRSQITGIYRGNLDLVAELKDANGAPLANPSGTNGESLRVCRRGDGSGTQRSHALHFLNQRCSGSLTFVAPENSTSGTAFTAGSTIRVFAGTGAADVQACMDDSVTNNRYAVGTLSLESNNFNSTDQRWRFVKVDGAFPSLENVNNGPYQFFVDSACNAPTTGNTANTLTAIQRALATGGVDTANKAVGLCGSIRGEVATVTNGGLSWRLGTLTIPRNAGTAADPTPLTPWDGADIDTNATNTATRAASLGGVVNNCNPPYTFVPVTTLPDLPTN